MSTIISSTPLLKFKGSRRMQVGAFVNKETNEEFTSCIFTDESGDRCFVAFSSKMGALSPKQIAEMKDDLQVVELESGNYVLCKRSANSWEDVEL